MTTPQLNEGQGSINVETQYDISRIQKLAGLANSSTVAGNPVTESIEDDIMPEVARELAGDIEQHLQQLTESLDSIEELVRAHLPSKYRNMRAYTFANIKAAIGGYGYVENYTSTSLAALIEELNEHTGEDIE